MGYIGPSVVKQLRQSFPQAHLVGLDMGYFAGCLTHAPVFPECRVETQHFSDIRQVAMDIFSGVDVVVHLAAISNDPMGHAYEEMTWDVNYRASIQVAELAKKAGVKGFVFSSSCSVYGSAGEEARIENSPVDPITAYAKSKVMMERGLEKLASPEFVVTCLRFATACGMSERLRLDLVLNDFVANAVASRQINILSDGTPWRPLINVKDMARAIDWGVHRAVAGDPRNYLVVNVGSEAWNYRIKDLADAVAKVIPGVTVTVKKDAPPDKRSYRVNFEMFQSLAPSYQPQCDVWTTIAELKEGLEAMKFQDLDFRQSPSFVRLKRLEELRAKGCINDRLEWMEGHETPSLAGVSR